MKMLIMSLAAALCFQAPAWAAQGCKGAVAGIVIYVSGKPQLKSKATGKSSGLKLNQFVCEGDTVQTKQGERASIAFVGGAEFRINENSTFELESGGGAKPTSIKTKVGQAWTRLLHGKSGLQVKSNLAVAAVRGTEADVNVGDQMTVKVYEGLVDVENEQGKQSLTAGMMTDVLGAGQAPQAPREMAPGDKGTWQDSIQPENLEENMKRLMDEAEKSKTLKLKTKEGKEMKLKLEKK